MHPYRIIVFAVSIAVASLLTRVLGDTVWGSASLTEHTPSLVAFITHWIFMVPITLLLSKWYFRRTSTTVKHGVIAGLCAIVVIFCLDVVSRFGGDLHSYLSEWKYYVTLFEIVLLTSYAGFEFDGTYTNDVRP